MATMAPQPVGAVVCPPYSRTPYGSEMDSCPVRPAPTTQRRYTLHESFYNVLAEVGAKQGQPYEWKDIIMLFIRYLARRKPSLLDPENKSRVICGDDPLGRVFGVSCFTKEETKLLVRQHVSLWEEDCAYASQPLASLPPASGPAPPPPNVEQPVKRGPAEVAPDDPDSKRSRPETAAAATATAGEPGPSCAPVAPAGPAPAPATADRWPNSIEPGGADGGDGDDGVDDGDDTEEAVDSCDDRRRTYAREMEPVECTDVSDSDSSSGASGVDSPLQLTILAAWGDDKGMMADMETSESDPEHRDTWVCAEKHCQHANSARRSKCDRCWQTRPSWVVGPRRKKRRQRDMCREASLLSRASAGSQGDCSVGSQETGETSANSQETAGSPSPPPPSPAAADSLCLICCERRRDAAIIHGRTGCQVTCYGCARRMWKRRDLCPSCRRTIQKIVFMRFG